MQNNFLNFSKYPALLRVVVKN